jgi:hypothetical protein
MGGKDRFYLLALVCGRSKPPAKKSAAKQVKNERRSAHGSM